MQQLSGSSLEACSSQSESPICNTVLCVHLQLPSACGLTCWGKTGVGGLCVLTPWTLESMLAIKPLSLLYLEGLRLSLSFRSF